MRGQAAASVAPLTWLAQAVAGRPLLVEAGQPGQPSWTDGATLYLDPFLDAHQQRCVVVAHAALLASGALSPPLTRRLRRGSSASQTYLTTALPWTLQAMAERVPARVAQTLRGLTPATQPVDSPQAALQWALNGTRHQQADWTPWPPWLGELRPAALRPDAVKPQAPLDGLPTRGASRDDAGDQDDGPLNDADRAALEKLRSPVRGFGLADVLLKLLDFRRSAGEALDDERANEATGSGALAGGAGKPRPRGLAQALAGRVLQALRGPERQGLWYPEWDAVRQIYRPSHVCVDEILPALDEDTQKPPPSVNVPGLRRALSRIGTVFEHVRGQPQGNDLDLDACIDFRVRRRSGDTPLAKVYRATRRSRRDLSVLVLLDISRSTADLGADGRTLLQVHADLAGQLAAGFERLGDRVALHGFHSWGRELVRLVRIKGFAERWASCAPRLSALEPSGMTRMGAALRHATHLLATERRHHQRLLILLTDGFSYDDGYEGGHAMADTERALAEASASGIATVCVHVGSEQDDDALARLYGQAAYVRVADSTHLSSRLEPLMGGALERAGQARAARHAQARSAH